jgi:hypothetical protein
MEPAEKAQLAEDCPASHAFDKVMLRLDRSLPIEEKGHQILNFFTIHTLASARPCSIKGLSSLFNKARALKSQLLIVPSGAPTISAISSTSSC